MRVGRVRKLAVVAVIVAVVVVLLNKLRGEAAPQFSNHPTVSGGPLPDSPAADAGEDAEGGWVQLEPLPTELHAPEPVARWVEPVDGACPDGYPVKAKLKSGIFHEPDSATYERTHPDRCYASAADAEADGLRPPKR